MFLLFFWFDLLLFVFVLCFCFFVLGWVVGRDSLLSSWFSDFCGRRGGGL